MRYDAFKKGDYVAAANPIPAELASKSANAGLSLIDLDDGPEPNNTAPQQAGIDLAGLFAAPSTSINSTPVMATNTGINLGGGSSHFSTYAPSPMASNGGAYGGGLIPGGNPAFATSPPHSTATPPASIMLPTTPSQRHAPAPNYFGGNNAPKGPIGTGGAGLGMGIGSMVPQQQQRQQQNSQQQPSSSSGNQVQGKDPFADLAGLF